MSVLDPVVFSQNKNLSGSYSCKLTASAFFGGGGKSVDRKLRVAKEVKDFPPLMETKKLTTVKIKRIFFSKFFVPKSQKNLYT